MKKKKIYIFGNKLLDIDNLPQKITPDLKKLFPKIDFILKDPNENLKPENKELIMIDTVANVKRVIVINDIEKIKTSKIYSAHDFDLAFNIKLLKKIGKLNKITIFGIPQGIKKQEALLQLVPKIKEYLKSN